MRFSLQKRLVDKVEFKTVFDNCKKINQRHLLVLFKPNQLPYARIGIVVGKRVARLAVSRNRIRRIIRESFRSHQLELKAVDMIVIARAQCDKLSKSQLRKGIDQLWEKLFVKAVSTS